MSSLDSTKIEKAAVQAVRDLIQPCKCINHKINEDDKNILVDGTLELYKAPKLTKANLIGVIEVQVKGTINKLRLNKRGFRKYKVSVEDLKRYLDVFNGVLFFCVTVDKDTLTAKDVYYAQLLPYDIINYLSAAEGQKSVSVRFKPFPKDQREITRFLLAFNSDRKKQLKADVAGYGFLNGDRQIPNGIKSMSFSVQLFSDEEITTLASWREGVYLYGEDEAGNTLVFDRMDDVVMFARGVQAKVSSGDFELTTTVFSGENEEGRYLEIEGVSLTISDKKATLNYTITGGFHKRYNTACLARAIIASGELSINDQVALRIGSPEDLDSHLCRLASSIEIYSQAVDTLDALRIGVDWDPDNMTEKELNDIDFMRRLLVEKESLAGRKIESPLVHFDIQETRVYAFAHEVSEETYELVDLFNEQLFVVFGWPDDRATDHHLGFDPIPPVIAIGKTGFKLIANLDSEKLSEAFVRFPVAKDNQWALNQKLLEMLEAFDEGCVQPEELLACAEVLARKLYEFDETSEVYLLNLMQTLRRKRELLPEEVKSLEDMVITSNQMPIKAAVYALLDENTMAQNCFNRCSEGERRQIENYPISHFLKENI